MSVFRSAVRDAEFNRDAIKRAAAREWRKLSHGRGKIPDYVVEAIAADYAQTQSLTITGRRFNRSPSTLSVLLRRRGHKMRGKGGAYHVASSDEVTARWLEYQRCKSLRKTAERFGVTQNAIRRMFIKRGLPLRPSGGSLPGRRLRERMKEAA